MIAVADSFRPAREALRPRPASRYTVAALDRGLRVLSAFSDENRRMHAAEVAAVTGLPLPTAFRMLRTLCAAGYVRQWRDGAYAPDIGVLPLGFAALRSSELVVAAEHPLEELARAAGETVNLAVLSGVDVLYLRRVLNGDLITANLQVGSRLPAHAGALGTVLLAQYDDDAVGAMPMPAAVAGSARSRDALLARIATARERGWAIQDADEDEAPGLRTVAVPVASRSGGPAGIDVAARAARWQARAMADEFVPALRRTARLISARLGR